MTRRFLAILAGSIADRLLALCVGFFLIATTFCATPTFAAGKMTWYANLLFHNPAFPNQDHLYGAGPFATKPQAIAAMLALDPNIDPVSGQPNPNLTAFYTAEKQLLVEKQISQMGRNSVQYSYAPAVQYPNPVNGPWNKFSWGNSNGYPDEASATAALTHSGSCNVNNTPTWVTANGGWVLQTFSYYPPPPYEVDDTKSYTHYTQYYYSLPSCSTTNSSLVLTRWRTVGCPPGYVDNTYGSHLPGYCYDYFTGTITGLQALECPAGGSPSTQVGDPCDVSTGDFSQTETDYSAVGLNFSRYYHSAVLESHHTLGVGWTHNYVASLVLYGSTPMGLLRPDGHHDPISYINGEYVSLSGAGIHVQGSGSNWIAYLGDGSSEVYNSTGQLIQKVNATGQITVLTYNTAGLLATITGPFGHRLQLAYDASNRLSTVTEPDGSSIITYAYDGNNNLISATYPDQSKRQYQYQNSSLPNNLTAILDESGAQFLSVQYDATTGAVVSSQQAGGAQAVSIIYNTNSAVVTDSLGASSTYNFTTDATYSPRMTSLVRNNLTQSYTVRPGSTDPQQRVTQMTDANGNITAYTYDTDHLKSKTEASGTLRARTTSYQYLSTNSALPTLVTETLRKTAYAYYPSTNTVQTKTVTDLSTNLSRAWNYTYDSYGRMLTAKGPRTDLNSTTTYTYYTCTTGVQCGQVQTVKDALGHVTTYNTYNAFGQPLTITDPNNVVTTLTYDGRQRLTSRKVGSETTSFSYWPTGLLKQVTLPDSSFVLYTYDGAHRLTQISDELGNKVVYTLDGMGNRTAEHSYDPSSAVHRTHTRVINALNEVYQEVNAAGTAAVTTTFGYDNNGNQTSVNAPLSRTTTNAYDELNRLKQITDPANGVTKLGYDAQDDLTSVIDPRNLTTSYTYNGFGDLKTQGSPDTGNTTNTYDSAGNLATATDARNAVATYSYDALNRVTQQAYSDQTIHFTYDVGTNGIGRLTGASDANHSLSWSYDALGRVLGKAQIVSGVTRSVGYGYTNGNLTSLITPSGQTLVYGYNANHQITSITVNGTSLLHAVTYEPLGAVNGWTWGNGTTVSRTLDTDQKVTRIATAGDVLTYGYDNAFRITGLSDTLLLGIAYTGTYDNLDRVTSLSSTANTTNLTYDANGNRLTQSGSSAVTYTTSSTSNRLNSTSGALVRTYAYDTAGNTQSYTGVTFLFNQRGRMSSATTTAGTTNYIYNALGQLIEKSGAGGTTLLTYDESGHLLGEYSNTGALIQETVWMGDTPVATLRPNGSTVSIYYVHTDHLNAPRVVTQSTDNSVRWLWGGNAANQNPMNLGTFVYNLRYPGQYYQAETALHQNGFRDYDPAVGRYAESDPIGLKAGVNTYAYVRSNPLNLFDRYGLLPGDCYPTENAAGANAVNDINWQSIQTSTEYAGRIYQNSDGTYSYTSPIPGTATTSSPGPMTPNTVGTYHTHGRNTPGYAGEGFSPADVSFSIGEGLFIPGYVAYLGTPFGVIKGFDPHSYIGDPQVGQFWNLPYPSPGGNVPCSCTKPN